MKKADKSDASVALILGDDECSKGVAAVKNLRQASEQEVVPMNALAERINQILAGE
jgi:histidyl-tRNA synthetase